MITKIDDYTSRYTSPSPPHTPQASEITSQKTAEKISNTVALFPPTPSPILFRPPSPDPSHQPQPNHSRKMLVFRSWGDFSEDPRLKDPNVQSAFRFPGLNDREITLIPLHTNIGELRSAYETNRAKALNKDIPFVLLIDDTETNLKIWSFILGELKIPFETANDGREAVRKVTCSSLRPYDIIITDIKMPTDGITTARTILAMLQNPETPQSKPIDILYCSTERKEDVARMMGDRASPFNHQESLPKDDPQGFKNKLVAFIKEKFPKYTLPPQRENTASEEDDRELLEMLGLN